MKLVINGTDYSQFYNLITWAGDENSAARTLDFGLVVSGTDPNLPKPTVMMQDEVNLYNDDGKEIFRGNVLDKEKSLDGNIMDVNCAEILIKANKDTGTFSFEEKTPDEIASEAFESIGLTVGNLETGSPIDRQFDMEKIYDIVYKAYYLEYEKTEVPYIIRMNDGNVEVVKKGDKIAQWQLDGKTNILNATYGESSKDTVSTVKIFDTEGTEIGEVTNDVKNGAVEIYRQEKDEDATARATELLKGVERSASIKVLGDFDYITGNAVMIKEPFTGLIGKFFIVSDTHTFANNKHVVELKLSYENIMNEIDTSLPADSSAITGDFSNLSGTAGQKAVQAGTALKGTKYVWGGNDSSGIDCSGFVDWAFTKAGYNIPGRLTSAALRQNPKQFGFVEIPFRERQPGDVLWQPGHVAMQYDATRVIEAGGTTKIHMGYSSVGIVPAQGRTFSKAYRYVGG